MIRQRIIATAAALAAMLGAAAPGSAASAGASVPGYAVAGDTITFGQTAAQSGPNAPIGEAKWGLSAFLAAVDHAGGVAKHKLALISYDDSYQPAQTSTLVRKLIYQNHVLALVGSIGSPTNAAVFKTLDALGVPLISPGSGSPAFAIPTRAHIFPVWPLYTTDGKTMGNFVKIKYPGDKVGVIYQDDAFGRPIRDGILAVLGHVAMQIPYVPSQVDFSSDIIKMKSSGIQVILLATIATSGAQILKQLDSLDYHPARIMTSSACGYRGIFKTVASLEGTYCTAFLPPPGSTEKQWTDFAAAMKTYEPGHPADTYAAWGWLAGQVAVAGLKAAKAPLDRDSLTDALDHLTNLPTIAGPLTYTPSDHRGLCCEFLWLAKSGAWQKVAGSTYHGTK